MLKYILLITLLFATPVAAQSDNETGGIFSTSEDGLDGVSRYLKEEGGQTFKFGGSISFGGDEELPDDLLPPADTGSDFTVNSDRNVRCTGQGLAMTCSSVGGLN